jgi:hypothetical protein
MPFQSKRQWRAAFSGRIPGFSKEKAREWAHETKGEFKQLPDRAPAEKGKPTLRSKEASAAPKAVYVAKKLREQLISSGTGKNVFDAMQSERERSRRKQASDEFVDFCAKIAFAVPRPGQVSMASRHVGSFSGQATTNFLKAPGSTTAAVTNPRLSLRNAMTKTMRT